MEAKRHMEKQNWFKKRLNEIPDVLIQNFSLGKRKKYKYAMKIYYLT